jgi:hypothetical protein
VINKFKNRTHTVLLYRDGVWGGGGGDYLDFGACISDNLTAGLRDHGWVPGDQLLQEEEEGVVVVMPLK